MKSIPTKICTLCGIEKPLSAMTRATRNGNVYYRGRCKTCDSARAKAWAQRHPERAAETYKQTLARRKAERNDPQHQSKYILQDTKQSDHRAGRETDLDRDFIAGAITQECSYCGETEIRMTLDRIDNDKGHTKDNVVPACIRCNYTRKNMPHEAWLLVAKGMREAREKGLFGSWTGRARSADT